MAIEPTQNGASALPTVLKTAEPTRTLPPPQSRIVYTIRGICRSRLAHDRVSTDFSANNYSTGGQSHQALPKKILSPVTMDCHRPLNARAISLWAVNPHREHTASPLFFK